MRANLRAEARGRTLTLRVQLLALRYEIMIANSARAWRVLCTSRRRVVQLRRSQVWKLKSQRSGATVQQSACTLLF